MAVEETVHFPIQGSDAAEEWDTTIPQGSGFFRLGPENRPFSMSIFHQLHCLRLLRTFLGDPENIWTDGHMQHCLNYLRQMILCNPDLTLEPADIMTRDFRTERAGSTHVCMDWSQLYDEMADNFSRWEVARAVSSALNPD